MSDNPPLPTIACIGTGNVGRSWATVFARAGHDVVLWDARPESAEAAARRVLAATVDVAGAGTVKILPTAQAAAAVASYVQESIAEQPAAKRALFAALDEAAPPDAVIASSTSALSASSLFEPLVGRGRCLIVHPVNPPHLVPLVELSTGPFTHPDTVDRSVALMIAVGQQPVVLRKEIDGFILNRLQWALLGEALHLVAQGVCTAADVDLAVTHGLARRWALLGPFEVGHLNADAGLHGYFDGLSEAMTRVRRTLRADHAPSAELIATLHAELAERLPVDRIAAAQDARDRRMATLRRFLDSEASDIAATPADGDAA